MAKRHLKVAGDLGRVIFVEMDLRNTASIEESVRHSDIVYNLIGRDYSTKNFDLDDVHVILGNHKSDYGLHVSILKMLSFRLSLLVRHVD